ncbi:MAG: glycosyltransferase family 39 protein [Desulfovibrio sp.]|nr:glycosyltransferase family 39 protein [Desulfovibrio sp.]MBI4959731.1 glycosyltransferase family 39 protein [Desulfovibrio sp.]
MIIVVIGFILRFAWLDSPTLMRDEALVLLAAEQSPLFILIRALATDAHPPYFYYLSKLLLLFGHSDFATRFFPALAGTAAVFFLHRFAARLISRESALIAAALLAGYFLHIQISRTVRPHPYIVCLTIVSLSWLLDFLRAPCRKNLIKLTCLNLALLLFHFNALLVVGSQMFLVGCLLPGSWRSQIRSNLIQFLMISCVSMAVNLPMFIYRLGKFPGFDLNISMLWTLERSITNLNKLMAIFPSETSNIAGWLLFGLGMGLLFSKNCFAFFFLASSIFLPIIALILAKYGLFYEPWHLSFIIPCLLTVCAHSLVWLLRIQFLVKAAALAIPICAAVTIFLSRYDALYSIQASIFGYEECNKKIALELPRGLGNPHSVLFNQIFELNFVNWYTRQFSSLNLNHNSLTPKDSNVNLALVASGPIYSDADNPVEVARRAQQLLTDFGKEYSIDTLSCSTIHRWNYARSPGIRLNSYPAKTSFTAYAPEFLKKVWQAQDVQIYLSPLAHVIFPSAFDTPGSFTVRYQNDTPVPTTDITLDLHYALEGSGNSMVVTCSFDDALAQEVFSSSAQAGTHPKRIILRAPNPYRTVDVTCTMTSSSLTPSFYTMSNAVSFSKMELTILPTPPEEFLLDLPVAIRDLSQVESTPEGSYRWGSGPETTLRFNVPKSGRIRLEMGLNNPIPGQGFTVLINDSIVKRLENLPAAPWLQNAKSVLLDVDVKAGDNTLVLRYDLWNGKPQASPAVNFAPGDGRALAMAFTSLRLLAPEFAGTSLSVEDY